MMLALIDLLETHGHPIIYSAAIGASHGDPEPFARLGLIGVDPASGERILDVLDLAELVTLERVYTLILQIGRGQYAPNIF